MLIFLLYGILFLHLSKWTQHHNLCHNMILNIPTADIQHIITPSCVILPLSVMSIHVSCDPYNLCLNWHHWQPCLTSSLVLHCGLIRRRQMVRGAHLLVPRPLISWVVAGIQWSGLLWCSHTRGPYQLQSPLDWDYLPQFRWSLSAPLWWLL